MLDKRTYFVREHVGFMKLHEAYDILDPETGDVIAEAREEASSFRKFLKLFMNKTMLPFEIVLTDASGKKILTIRRGFTFLRSRVEVYDAADQLLGTFQQKLFSIGGRFKVLDAQGVEVAELKGNLIGWDFKFLDIQGNELGRVTKKWAGVGKELFTTADNYVVTLSEEVDPVGTGPLLLAAALCVDMVLKEKSN